MSKDHRPGSVTLSVLAAGDPHPVKLEALVTALRELHACLVEFKTPLVIPVRLLPVIPVYEINSLPATLPIVPTVM